jgi:hypothetical protein
VTLRGSQQQHSKQRALWRDESFGAGTAIVHDTGKRATHCVITGSCCSTRSPPPFCCCCLPCLSCFCFCCLGCTAAAASAAAVGASTSAAALQVLQERCCCCCSCCCGLQLLLLHAAMCCTACCKAAGCASRGLRCRLLLHCLQARALRLMLCTPRLAIGPV